MSRKRNNAMKFEPKSETPNQPTQMLKTPLHREETPATKKQKLATFMSRGFIRALGVMLLMLSATVYPQLVSLALVFIGGVLAIQPDASLNSVDAMIWILTCIAVIVPMIWIFLIWVKYIWGRFIIEPISFFPSRLSK